MDADVFEGGLDAIFLSCKVLSLDDTGFVCICRLERAV